MCSSPKPPAPTAPQPPTQAAKTPDIASVRRGRAGTTGIPGGTLLTGPSGVANNMLTTGGGTLLGG